MTLFGNSYIIEDVASSYSDSFLLEKTVNDVKNVRELVVQGVTVKEIAKGPIAQTDLEAKMVKPVKKETWFQKMHYF